MVAGSHMSVETEGLSSEPLLKSLLPQISLIQAFTFQSKEDFVNNMEIRMAYYTYYGNMFKN